MYTYMHLYDTDLLLIKHYQSFFLSYLLQTFLPILITFLNNSLYFKNLTGCCLQKKNILHKNEGTVFCLDLSLNREILLIL